MIGLLKRIWRWVVRLFKRPEPKSAVIENQTIAAFPVAPYVMGVDVSDKPDMTTLVLDGQAITVMGPVPGPSPEQIQALVDKFKLTPEELEKINEVAQKPQSTADILNGQVPSFSEWFARRGKEVIAREAEAGKPGAFLLMQMMAQQDPPEEKND